ncbi:hypothetical protein AB0M36_17735 [Actinoplanes sp. NPDC051346]
MAGPADEAARKAAELAAKALKEALTWVINNISKNPNPPRKPF